MKEFEKRLQVVKNEIEKRIEKADSNIKSEVRRRLWVKWIGENLLKPEKKRNYWENQS